MNPRRAHPAQASSWRLLFATPQGLFWAGSYLVFALLAWFTPPSVLDDWQPARSFSDFVASHIPQIDAVTRKNGWAWQINRFVYSVVWAVVPVYATVFLVQGYRIVRAQGCGQCGSCAHFAAILFGSFLLFLASAC